MLSVLTVVVKTCLYKTLMKIANQGNPASPIWCVVETPYEKDKDKGFLFSCPYGWVFKKMWKEAEIPIEPFYFSMSPDLDNPLSDEDALQNFIQEVHKHKPPLIVPLGKRATALVCPETILKKKGKKNANAKVEASLDKYSSSLLNSPFAKFEHYAIPNLAPHDISANWSYRNIGISIDLGRVRDEYIFYVATKQLHPLRSRNLVTEPDYYALMEIFANFRQDFKDGKIRYLACDIETIRPRRGKGKTKFPDHPGYPYTNSFASSPDFGVSYSYWDYEDWQLVQIWRETAYILRDIPQIGQNYFTFDAHFHEAMGFEPCLTKCEDTLIRHHILWPELPHSLQFQTKQYTRQPYYKDEGKQWSPKQKKRLMHYNALDTTVDFEVYLAQEEEFNERPYLR